MLQAVLAVCGFECPSVKIISFRAMSIKFRVARQTAAGGTLLFYLSWEKPVSRNGRKACFYPKYNGALSSVVGTV